MKSRKPLEDELGRHPKGVGGTGRNATGSAALTRAYRDKLDTVCLTDPKRRTYAQLIADRMVELALDGSVTATVEITDRIEGKARQSVEVHTDPYASMTDAELAEELERLGIEPTVQ